MCRLWQWFFLQCEAKWIVSCTMLQQLSLGKLTKYMHDCCVLDPSSLMAMFILSWEKFASSFIQWCRLEALSSAPLPPAGHRFLWVPWVYPSSCVLITEVHIAAWTIYIYIYLVSKGTCCKSTPCDYIYIYSKVHSPFLVRAVSL